MKIPPNVTFTSDDIRNNLIQIMADKVTKYIADEVGSAKI
jgi:hypothetical protein